MIANKNVVDVLSDDEKSKRYERSRITRAVLRKQFSLIIDDATLIAANTAVDGGTDSAGAQTTPHVKPQEKSRFGWLRERHSQFLEVLILAPVIMFIIGLFLIPTMYYALPNSPTLDVRTHHAN